MAKELPVNQIICGDCLEVMKHLPDESINCCISSPPFWALRDYGVEPSIWDGDKNCRHKFEIKIKKNPMDRGGSLGSFAEKRSKDWVQMQGGKTSSGFCSKCGAWRGTLGLEPTFDLYIKHLCGIYDEVKRVLRPDGTCWVNLGTCFNDKCDQLIPERFAIEMVRRDWIKRRTIIWHKPNPMPSSVKDDFTSDFEYVYFFVKSNKTQQWVNNKTGIMTTKQPLGTKGVEGIDWEWREVGVITENSFNVRVRDADTDRFLVGATETEKINYKKSKLKKVSVWKSYCYFFEPIYEPYSDIADIQYRQQLRIGKNYDQSLSSKSQQWANYGAGFNPLDRNKRTVWTIPTQAFPDAHFATFPEALVRPMIEAGCPREVCTKCGLGRRKVYETEIVQTRPIPQTVRQDNLGKCATDPGRHCSNHYFKGYTDCGCGAGWRPGVVLDMFRRFRHGRQGRSAA